MDGLIIMENPIKMDDLGVPPFKETTIYWEEVFTSQGYNGMFFLYTSASRTSGITGVIPDFAKKRSTVANTGNVPMIKARTAQTSSETSTQLTYQYNQTRPKINLIGGWTNPSGKIWVKLEIFPKFRGENKNMWNHHLETGTSSIQSMDDTWLAGRTWDKLIPERSKRAKELRMKGMLP